MVKRTSWKEAIIQVLSEAGESLHYTEITNRIIQQKLLKDVGATPANSVNSTITQSIISEADNSPFIRAQKGKGLIGLRTYPQTEARGEQQAEVDRTDLEPEILIRSFGMYWERKYVDWKSQPNLYGQQEGAEKVNFCNQKGVYILYDNHSIVYVGQADKLGPRLWAHTKDRLSGRWNRFSWFGFLDVTEKGALEEPCIEFLKVDLKSTFEAVLIESTEPPLNRQRPKMLEAIEFYQVDDPEIENKRITAILEDVIRSRHSSA